jgi:zinc protease
VVLNERRQNYENRPYGFALIALSAALFPPEHPYHWLTIGAADDIRAMEFEDVRAFFRMYYHPANASLVLAGDIERERAFDMAEAYFGDLATGTPPPRVEASATLAREQRIVREDRIELPRLYIGWLTPAMFAPDDAELDLVADMVANGKSSRLYRTLVYEQRLAVDVSASQSSREIGSFFLLVATAAPGRSLADVAAAIDAELQRFAEQGPTGVEMERAEAQAESHFVYRLQTVGGFGGKSDQLNAYNVMLGDPGSFAADLERYRRATRESVRAAAQVHLPFDRRVLLSIVPRGQLQLALPGSEPVSVS